MNQTPNLFAALVKARAAVGATVFKAGRNDAQRYSYVGHEQVMLHARKALCDHGLVLMQTGTSFLANQVYKTSTKELDCWRWCGHFVLGHVSGEQMTLVFEATTGTNDKAGFVASTALDRTAHMRVLELAGSDDENPEHNSHEPAGSDAPSKDTVKARMLADLGMCEDFVGIVKWLQNVMAFGPDPLLKKELFEQLQTRATALKLEVRRVVDAAKES